MRLKIVSYNIQHGEGLDGVVSLERTIGTLKKLAPDIAIINEVDVNWHRSGYVDQAHWLAQALAMPFYYFAPNLTATGAGGEKMGYGNLLLSRFPILAAQNHPLPRTGVTEPRGLLEAVVMVGDTPLQVFGTHLGLSGEERVLQMQEIRRIYHAVAGSKVLGGDFNTTPEEGEISLLNDGTGETDMYDAFVLAGGGETLTYPADLPLLRIDYLFVSGDLAGRVQGMSVYPSDTSDHLPVLMELRWGAEEGENQGGNVSDVQRTGNPEGASD